MAKLLCCSHKGYYKLQTLKAAIKFDRQQMTVFDDATPFPLVTNSAGQFVVNLMGSDDSAEVQFDAVVKDVHMSESMD